MDSALLLASELIITIIIIIIIILLSLVVEQFNKLKRNSHVHNLHTRHIRVTSYSVILHQKFKSLYKVLKLQLNSISYVLCLRIYLNQTFICFTQSYIKKIA